MTKKVEKAPDGEWAMADSSILAALGHFIMAWSLVESTIEVCIAKQLGLGALEGSIVTAGLQFKSRSAVLMSLLNRDQKANAEAIGIVKAMQNIGDRNDILHSVVGGNKSVIWFNRRKTDSSFKSKIERYDALRLQTVSLQCSDLSGALMKSQGIGKEDYVRFFQESHNAVNNA
jgi:hypothetical protein